MHIRRTAALIMSAGLIFAACGDDDDTDAGSDDTAAAARGNGGRWGRHDRGRSCRRGLRGRRVLEQLPGTALGKLDEPAIKAAVEAGGGSYVSNDAKSSAETQATNIENLISQGANVLIVLAQDGTAIRPVGSERDRGRRAGHRI